MSGKPKTVDEATSAFASLIEKYPVAIIDVSMLPVSKNEMKVLLKALYAKATTPELQNYLAVGFALLSHFQEGVGPGPIDAPALPKDRPTNADVANLDKWIEWQRRANAEGEDLLAEWRRFLGGEPI